MYILQTSQIHTTDTLDYFRVEQHVVWCSVPWDYNSSSSSHVLDSSAFPARMGFHSSPHSPCFLGILPTHPWSNPLAPHSGRRFLDPLGQDFCSGDFETFLFGLVDFYSSVFHPTGLIFFSQMGSDFSFDFAYLHPKGLSVFLKMDWHFVFLGLWEVSHPTGLIFFLHSGLFVFRH